MIRLKLSNSGANEGVKLYLPATPTEVDEAFSWLERIGIKPSAVRIAGVNSSVSNLGPYILRADIHDAGQIEMLNELAETIEQMTNREIDIFAGALDAESINGLDDILKLSQHLNDYVIFPNISTDTELGRFLVDSGYKDFPKEIQPYLDHRAIGAEYYSDNGGAYGPGGYVRRKNALEQKSVRRDALITLHMATSSIYNFCLSLPATEEEMDRSKHRLGVENFVQANIIQVEYSKPYLADLIPKDCISVSLYLRIANVFHVSIDHFLEDAMDSQLSEITNLPLLPTGTAEKELTQDVLRAVLMYLQKKDK